MNVGIIYGTSSGSIRRIIIAETELELDGHLGIGESMLKSDDTILSDGVLLLDVAQNLVEQEIGREVLSSRCVVLDSGTFEVVSVIAADPLLDSIEGGFIIRDENAGVGWFLENGQAELTPPVSET